MQNHVTGRDRFNPKLKGLVDAAGPGDLQPSQ